MTSVHFIPVRRILRGDLSNDLCSTKIYNLHNAIIVTGKQLCLVILLRCFTYNELSCLRVQIKTRYYMTFYHVDNAVTLILA